MSKSKRPLVPPLSIIYRRIAISFVVLTVLLVGIIVFFSLAKATVAVTPKKELKSAEFLVTAKDSSALDSGVIQGKYEERVLEEEEQFETTGVSEKQGRAEGKVTLKNNTSAAQPLVATTRLLSPEGVLFRMKTAAVVPAKGSAEVAVYADAPGAQGDIGPTKFTIPGLNSIKQTLIYGESTSPMTGGARKMRVVTADDLERAKTEVIDKAVSRVKEEFERSAQRLGGVAVSVDVLEVVYSVNKGEERPTFTARAKVKAKLLAYDKAALQALALEKVRANIPADRELVQLNKDALIIKVRNVGKGEEVQLSVYGDAQVILSAASPILDPVKLAGMLPEEVVRYLESFDAVESVEVRLFPSWQKRIPTIPDRIKIVIKK